MTTIAVSLVAGAVGMAVIGGGTALFLTVGTLPGIGVTVTGTCIVLADGIGVSAIAIRSCTKSDKKTLQIPVAGENETLVTSDTDEESDDQLFDTKYLNTLVLKNGTVVQPDDNISLTRKVVKYQTADGSFWFVKASFRHPTHEKNRAPLLFTDSHHWGGDPKNDFIAYAISKTLGLGVVPETHLDAISTLFELQVYQDSPTLIGIADANNIKYDVPVIIQQGVGPLILFPKKKMNISDGLLFINNLRLDKKQVHRRFLFGLISGLMDDHAGRLENDAICEDGRVVAIDCEQIGLPIQALYKHDIEGEGADEKDYGWIYTWLLDCDLMANTQIDSATLKLIQDINVQTLTTLFENIEQEYDMDLHVDFKKCIIQNLKDVQHAIKKLNQPTPKSLFAYFHPKFKTNLEHEKDDSFTT